MTVVRSPGSFRDPDGFVFRRDGELLRQVHASYQSDWTLFEESGLRQHLMDRRWLVPHAERPQGEGYDTAAWRVLAPEPVPWVSYPYEWTPRQLQAAALLTLDVQRAAVQHGMTLKDASAYNVQFVGSRPVFIDTLSFTARPDGAPWAGYRQFCQQFLAPLALMQQVDPRLRDLQRTALDGPDLGLASRLLPRRSWLDMALLTHVHLHARSIARRGGRAVPSGFASRGVSERGALALLEHLQGAVRRMATPIRATEWDDYETEHNYTGDAMAAKRAIVARVAAAHSPRLSFDLGANTGQFSEILAEAGSYVVAFDADAGAVERCWERQVASGSERILPLWSDLTNPSPSQGWGHTERDSLAARGPADLALALALVHHLAISHNVPLSAIVAYLAQLARRVVLEWVPKDDPQVQRLLVSRPDIFSDYTEAALIASVEPHFAIESREAVGETGRVMFVLGRR